MNPQSCIADSDKASFEFVPERFSDVTIHYQSASFHLHRYVLSTMSKYFVALLCADVSADDEPCKLSDRCRSSSVHRCFTLDDQIGGVDVTVNQLNSFFRHLYAFADGSQEWQNLIESDRPEGEWPEHYYLLRIVSTDAEKDEVMVDSYEHDRVHTQLVRGKTVNVDRQGECKASAAVIGSWYEPQDVKEHPNYHLADYFQCIKLMQHYEAQAETIVRVPSGILDQVWRILLLADRYKWQTVRSICMEICAKDTQCGNRSNWKKIVVNMKQSTITELFIAGLKRQKL
jgi:hypothetical protein